jgi:competence protein ComEA
VVVGDVAVAAAGDSAEAGARWIVAPDDGLASPAGANNERLAAGQDPRLAGAGDADGTSWVDGRPHVTARYTSELRSRPPEPPIAIPPLAAQVTRALDRRSDVEPAREPALGRFRSVVDAATPAALRGARLDPGRRGVVVLVLIALVAAAVAGVGAWRARPAPEPVAVPAPEQVSGSPSASALLVVAVAGKVRRPGVVRLPAGSRVADAVTAAGGALPGADLSLVNLARKVVDGEQIVVGVPAPAGAPPPAAGGQAVPGPAPGALLDLNTATLAQLDTLPGVGPVLAQRLIEYRTAKGGFRSVDQLREVDGIGESRFQRLKGLVTV